MLHGGLLEWQLLTAPRKYQKKGNSMTSNTKKSAYNIFFGVVCQIVIALVGILIPRMFITSFGSEVNGFLSSINQIFTYIVLLEAGVGTATLQALYKPVAKDDWNEINGIMSATAQFYRRTGWCYLACVVLLAIVYPIFIHSEIPVWQQVAVILIVGGSGSIGYFIHGKYRMLLRADGKTYVYTNASTLVQLGTNITKIVMIALGLNIVFVQLGHMLLTLALALYIRWYTKRHYRNLNLNASPNKAAIAQKNSVLIHEISQMVFNHTDVFLLTVFTDLKVVSVYVIYNTVVEIISTLIGNIHNGFSFRLGQLYNTDEARYVQTYDIYETCYMMLSMALYCVTYIFLLPFMRLYTSGIEDANYLDKWLPILFVSIKLLVSGRALAGATITYAGKFKETRNRAIIEMCINLVVSVVCVNLLGIYGVLIGTLAALLYRANDMIIFTRKRVLGQSPWKTYAKWVVNLIVFVVIVFLSNRLFPINADNFFSLILYAIGYLIMVFALYGIANALVFHKHFSKILHLLKKQIHK